MKSKTEKIYGIVGSGIGYSLPPLIFNTLFRAQRLPAVYRLFDTAPAGLPNFVKAAELLELDGFNVTIPFKEEVIEFLQKLDPIAAATGSVNLVLNRRGRWTGYNTDYYGIAATLEKFKNLQIRGSSVTVVGSGGAARTLYYLLSKQRAGSITLYHHSRQRRQVFESYVAGLSSGVQYEGRNYRDKIHDLSTCDLLVNCTPQPVTKLISVANLKQAKYVFEMRYAGTRAGAKNYLDGSYMLAVQAAHNFKLMTGLEVSPTRILRICKEGR